MFSEQVNCKRKDGNSPYMYSTITHCIDFIVVVYIQPTTVSACGRSVSTDSSKRQLHYWSQMSSRQQCGRTSTVRGKHTAHDLLRWVVVLVFAVVVRHLLASVVAHDLIVYLDAASTVWQVVDHLQSFARLTGRQRRDLLHLTNHRHTTLADAHTASPFPSTITVTN